MKTSSPLLSNDSRELLDHIEISALTDPDQVSSISQLKSELMVSGSEDALTDEITEGTPEEYIEGLLDSLLTEAEDRITACGEKNYPFSLRGKALSSKESSFSRIYTFLLCLSLYGKDAVTGQNAAKLFEDVCADAVAAYLGCYDSPAEKYVFGFPRRVEPKDFPSALRDLCEKRLLEGEPDVLVPDVGQMKDAGLDVVAWVPFPDRRSSKLIAFGQCATGTGWRGKVHELQPSQWLQTWLRKHPKVVPIKVFFVPHAVNPSDWERLGYHSGIFFDRFRITCFAESVVSQSLRDDLERWSTVAAENAQSKPNDE